jgi:GTP cyclohydrolase I
MSDIIKKPSKEQAMEAVKTLLAYAGDNPEREGLLDTPKRVVEAYEEWFEGYAEDPSEVLSKTFGETDGYDEMVLLKNMRFVSHCEHHMAPIIGKAHVAYIPTDRVVGISKIARLVDIYAKRLQTQERMTSEVCNALERALKPKGIAVIIDSKHQCMTTRGVNKHETTTITSKMTGLFKSDPRTRSEFMEMVSSSWLGKELD